MTPRIYVASLSDYNSGRLHGAWIDAAQDGDAIQEDIQAMLRASPAPGAEEWAVHDIEDLPDLGEYPSVEQVSTIAQCVETHGEPFLAYADWFGTECATEEDFIDRYIGEFPTQAAYAEDYLENTGGLAEIPEHLWGYFDFDAFGRDCLLSGDVFRRGDHWFRNW